MAVALKTPIDDDLRQRAIERLARLRLSEIEETRDVCVLWRSGLSQRSIAERLNTTQPRIGRIQKILGAPDRDVPETIEEIILRTIVQHGDRTALIAALKECTFTYGEGAPAPYEGSTTGTWDDIEDAYFEGLLTQDEYEEIRAVAGPDNNCSGRRARGSLGPDLRHRAARPGPPAVGAVPLPRRPLGEPKL